MLAIPSTRSARQLIRCAMLVVAVAAGEAASAQAPRVNPQAATLKAFSDRVNAYIQLQQKAAEGLPQLSPSDEPSKAEARQAAVAARIRLARPHAKPGEIFGDAAPLFVEIIRQDTKARTTRDANATREEVPAVVPKVNADYPEKGPLATMPPLILARLPPLPEGIEYRFMGTHLILRDVEANLIADAIAEPSPLKSPGK